MCVAQGKAVYSEVTDNWPTIEPYFQEVGANSPSVLTRAQQDELIKLSIDATLSLGFTMGVFHVESKYTSHGARLIEVNCRMGGMQARLHTPPPLPPRAQRPCARASRVTRVTRRCATSTCWPGAWTWWRSTC